MKIIEAIFQIGQCWTSEGEPELGIGFVQAHDFQSVTLEFPSAGQSRIYRKKTAPLKRLVYRVGEKIKSRSGQSLTIARVDQRDSLNWYCSVDGIEWCENELSSKLSLQRPYERFLAGYWDTEKAFRLRQRSLNYYFSHLHSDARGMLGPKVQLLPHQVYVTHEISKRGFPRALLADEVGLGKTIEAAWILHRLMAIERVRRVLILVPEALINQWFVELFRKFNLSFWVPASQALDAIQQGDISDQERVILGTESFASLFEQGLLKADDWDLVIVDEAHRILWQPDNPSAEYSCLKALAERSPGLLLLTATPEQLGFEGHFSRLHLIDPVRFPDLETCQAEYANYVRIATEASTSLKDREEVLDLIDRYGTGRVYFRNSRSVVSAEGYIFPKRKFFRYEIEDRREALPKWLAEFVRTHPGEKALLISSSTKKVVEWERRLREDYGLKVVAFHEELPLIARDRNAAYFQDPQGAILLLCSEIGGEGRNFQFASHLILADIPEDPDLLEQRIGRLDRIGQVSQIAIHVPYVAGSKTEEVLKWHHEVLDAFQSPPKGAREIFEKYQGRWSEIEKAKNDYLDQVARIEAGRDRLIEINSFDPGRALAFVGILEQSEKSQELKAYFEDLLDTMGLHSDDLDSDSLFVDPGQGQYVSYFPGLPPEGLSFTFNRKKALQRNDLALMTWDHPMVTETLRQIVSQEYGNVAVAHVSSQGLNRSTRPLLSIECHFVLEGGLVNSKWASDEYFPSTALSVSLDATGAEIEKLSDTDKLLPISPAGTALIKKIPPERIRQLIDRANVRASTLVAPIRAQGFARMNTSIDAEIARLQALQEKNKTSVGEAEIQWWTERKTQLTLCFDGAQVRLDSFLIVLPN